MNYLNNWQPARYTYLQDKKVEEAIYENGYAIVGRLDNAVIERLKELYSSTHNFQQKEGGMFYSVYSQNLDYREKINNNILELLKPTYDLLFADYKTIINSFIVKVPGPKSSFYLHQDSTGLDEQKYSCLSTWIPLQDTTVNNGCMFMLPKSHKMFSPYRGISFPSPYENIQDLMKEYMVPVELKVGDVLLFDNRVVHFSGPNMGQGDRVVVMSGIFPNQARVLNCFKNVADADSEIEILEQEDSFLLEYPSFLQGCYDRPHVGKTIGWVKDIYTPISADHFSAMCTEWGIPKVNKATGVVLSQSDMIGEPVEQALSETPDVQITGQRNLLKRIKERLSW